MNWRIIIMISVALNVLLLAFMVKLRQKDEPIEAAHDVGSTAVYRTNIITRTITNIVQSDVTEPIEVRWPNWNELVGDEWVGYRDNLLAIECPPPTVEKILSLELQRLQYEERREVIAHLNSRFWDLIANHGSLDEEIAELEPFRAKFDEMEENYQSLARDLFNGIPGELFVEPIRPSESYSHLDEERQLQLAQLEREHRDEVNALRSNKDYQSERNRLTEEGNAKLAELNQNLAAQRQELMNDEEYQEYQLRRAGAAEWASQYGGFEPTNEEMRQIAERQSEFNKSHPRPRRNDPNLEERRAARSEAQAKLNGEIRLLLGEVRFAEYERSKDSAMRDFSDLAFVFDLPDRLAVDGFEMRLAALNMANDVRGQEELTPVQKREALRAIQQETIDSLSALLGKDYFFAYERKEGDWIRALSNLR